MRAELEKKLLDRFPILYQERHLNSRQSCMAWGFTCGDGWFDIVWQLSLAIEDELNYSWLTQKRYLFMAWFKRLWNRYVNRKIVESHGWAYTGAHADQVKEKFGALRYYFSFTEPRINRLIRMAEDLSEITCETCGARGKLQNDRSYIQTLCNNHARVK